MCYKPQPAASILEAAFKAPAVNQHSKEQLITPAPATIETTTPNEQELFGMTPAKHDLPAAITPQIAGGSCLDNDAEALHIQAYNDAQFRPFTDVFPESFLARLRKEFPRVNQAWKARAITGDNFDLHEYLQPDGHVPNTDAYVAYLFKRYEGDNCYSKLFECKYGKDCHMIMPNPSKFMDHLRSHTKEKPFKCPYAACGKAFGQLSNVKQHIVEVHEQKKPFACVHCLKAFGKRYNRDNHEKTCRHKKK